MMHTQIFRAITLFKLAHKKSYYLREKFIAQIALELWFEPLCKSFESVITINLVLEFRFVDGRRNLSGNIALDII